MINTSKKSLLYRLPLGWKMTLLFGLLVGLISGIVYLTFQVPILDKGDVIIIPVSWAVLSQSFYKMLAAVCSAIIIVFLYLYFDLHGFQSQLRGRIRESLEERHLEQELAHFYQPKTLQDLTESVDHLFHLYKTFDQMKTSRCYTEALTSKILMNNLEEGVMVVDTHKTVTAINHSAEQLLRLIPGEILGLSISRKISNNTLLESLDLVVEKGQKVIDKRMALPERKKLQMTILPVTNKKYEVVRALILLTPVTSKKENA